jgi:hypothetical protein
MIFGSHTFRFYLANEAGHGPPNLRKKAPCFLSPLLMFF